jgi:hypothetical protein
VNLRWASVRECHPKPLVATSNVPPMDPTPRDEMDSLLDMLLPFAQQQLEKHSEFFPFAGSIDSSGALATVAVDLGEERPASTDVIDSLYEALARSAASGEIRAAGICADVRITPPGSGDQTDAIRTSIEHAEGDPVEVYMPYAKRRMRGFQFGDLFAQPGTPRIFARSG